MRWTFVLVAVSAAMMLVQVRSVSAHPSDFETLTLDFLIGPTGLELIEAAVVESSGPGYEPFPSSELKRNLAVGTVDALRVSLSSVEINEEMSERYHEVGFMIHFIEPSLGGNRALSIDSTKLQQLAADAGLERVKMSVCGVTDGAGASNPSLLSELHIESSQGSRRPAGLDREACRVWTAATTDPPISIVLDSQNEAEDLPQPGANVGRAAAFSLVLLLVGVAVAVWQRPR